MSEPLQKLIDKDEIRDVMGRYVRGVDRLDWEAVRACFHLDATDHHGDFHGARDDFIAWVSANHAKVAKSTHLLGSILIEFATPDRAAVESYFAATLELAAEATGHREMLVDEAQTGDPGRIRVEVLGRYADVFERRDGAWRIAKRRVAFDTLHSGPARGDVDKNVGWALGTRSGADPIYRARADAGLAPSRT